MGMKTRWMRFGRWGAPHAIRVVSNVGVVSIFIMMMLALLIIPASLFLVIVRRTGTNVNGNLHLQPLGHWLLYVTFAVMFAWSVVTGGFARTFLRPRHLDWPWLVLLGLALLIGLTTMGGEAREAINQLHSETGNDNAQVIAFFAFWLLMIGYSAKAVWDEARDRVAAYFERRISEQQSS